VQPKVTYAQAPHLFRNLGGHRFEELTSKAGPALGRKIVARGAAYADVDNDGDLDLVITTNRGPAKLLRNDGGNRHHMLRVKLVGSTSNRDAIGAKVRLTLDGGARPWSMVKTGSSYCSQSELPLTFGLGSATSVKAIEVVWPNGRVENIPATGANQTITIQEGKGIVAKAPLAPRTT